jgi:hypothetical protein
MKKGGFGGASTKTGLIFEERVDLSKQLESIPGYDVIGDNVFFNEKKVAQLLKKHNLYKKFLEPQGVNYKDIISAKLLPDEAIYVIDKKEIHIVEMKFQQGSGSVVEKLQTCDFKKKQYIKLLSPLNISVNFTYILSDWFKQEGLSDVFEYIKNSGCNYFFTEIPLDYLGLPY